MRELIRFLHFVVAFFSLFFFVIKFQINAKAIWLTLATPFKWDDCVNDRMREQGKQAQKNAQKSAQISTHIRIVCFG